MLKRTRDLLRNVALAGGIALERTMDEQDICRFLEALHPVVTRIPLIRLGGEADGGYLVPDDLNDILACFSPGVDVTATFELELVRRGIPCFLADASVDKAPIEHPLVHFQKKYLGLEKDQISLDAWVNTCAPPQGDLLLQMDIEGAEWPVLLNVSDRALERFRIIIIEFHYLESIFHKSDLRIFQATFARLLQYFHVVHSHPNNVAVPIVKGRVVVPKYLEMTFLRKDRAQALGFSNSFPHPLDRANVPSLPDFALPRVWYR
jgi:Methyltransferase FkbM domain